MPKVKTLNSGTHVSGANLFSQHGTEQRQIMVVKNGNVRKIIPHLHFSEMNRTIIKCLSSWYDYENRVSQIEKSNGL